MRVGSNALCMKILNLLQLFMMLFLFTAVEEIAANAYDDDVSRLKVAQIYNQV